MSPIQTWPITVTADAGVNVTPNGSPVDVPDGQQQTFSFVLDPGYYITDVKYDSVTVGVPNSYQTPPVRQAHTLHIFASNVNPTITATASTGGTIAPSGSVVVPTGTDQFFEITPGNGYAVAGVTVDGVAQGFASGYQFTMVQAQHTIAATFTRDIINAIIDALVTVLKTINGSAGGYTLDLTGKQVERAPTLLDWGAMTRPYVGVKLERVQSQEPLSDGVYRATGSFVIGFLVGLDGNALSRELPERLAAVYAQDISRAIAQNVNLLGVLASGYCYPGEIQVSQDPTPGIYTAIGSVTVTASWLWTTT